ncbi:MAG: PAS domain-containing protein [Chloroflexia bacterium]|nr:PAS domain-containing protein [Chloroflexia bacterium]
MRVVTDRDLLEPGVIYVVPPNRDVMVTETEIRLHEDGQGPHPSIDLLFTSAAEAFGESLIAVVLSGTGSDGAAGAREVKFAGGTVIIQNPETAAFPGMPLSLAPSIVDIVANLDRIGELLDTLVMEGFDAPPVSEQTQLQTFLDQICEHSGIDFSSYKQPTILRRLHRRMVATGQSGIPEYIRHVRNEPAERQRLISSFLIKVTEFFRDPELFTHLEENVLPELIQQAEARGEDLRIWSAGCATGEEAYSLAIMVSDLLREDEAAPNVRIFATDLDDDAVAFARRGIYPARSLRNLPETMVHRHFVKFGNDYEVSKHLRSMLVFGQHDLGQRAPFPRIDLILCRNVLIYFTPALQRRALQLFAFSLRAAGYLVLGKSETVNPLAEFFAVDEPRLKIYGRIGDRVLFPPSRMHDITPGSSSPPRLTGPLRGVQPASPGREPARARIGLSDAVHALLGVPCGVVVVDRDYDIHYLNSEARRLFGIHTTALDQDFVHLIHHFDARAIRRAIDRVAATGTPAELILQAIDSPTDARRTVSFTCSPHERGDGRELTLFVLSAIDVTEREELRQRHAVAENDVGRLVTANEEVLLANEELASTILSLRSKNEELLVSVEEIQAATEEVETLNEELQASNEELETLNEELQATVEERNTTNNDMRARSIEMQEVAAEAESTRQQLRSIVDGVEGAVVVVDADGVVVLENAAHAALLASNEDAVMVDSSHQPIPVGELPLQRAARGEQFLVRFAFGQSDHEAWYIATGNPRTTADGTALGIVTIREESGSS